VIPNTIPFSSPKLIQPKLWHRDLSGSNIFISETELAKGRISITSIIDWQITSVDPLYMQACGPRLFRYHALWNLPRGLEIVALPQSRKLEVRNFYLERTLLHDNDGSDGLVLFIPGLGAAILMPNASETSRIFIWMSDSA